MDDGTMAQQAAAAADQANPIYQYLLQLGGGGIAGIAVGYASKIAFRAAMFVLGAILIVMYLLNSYGFITVNWGAVSNGIESGAVAAGSWFWNMLCNLSIPFVGFGFGAWLGWKKLGR